MRLCLGVNRAFDWLILITCETKELAAFLILNVWVSSHDITWALYLTSYVTGR